MDFYSAADFVKGGRIAAQRTLVPRGFPSVMATKRARSDMRRKAGVSLAPHGDRAKLQHWCDSWRHCLEMPAAASVYNYYPLTRYVFYVVIFTPPL